MAVRFINPQCPIFDLEGELAPGAKVRFYDSGTSNPRPVYTDPGLTVAYSQPVVADNEGFLPAVFVSTGTYKITVHSAADVLLGTYDNIDPSLSTAAGALPVASGGTGATTAAGARANLGAASQVALDALDARVADLEALTDNPILAAAVPITFASTIAPNFTDAETKSITLTGALLLDTPTVTVGQRVRLVLIQDATGGRTWTNASAWKWPGNDVKPLSTTASAIDVLEGYAYAAGVVHVTAFKRQDALSNIAIIEDQKASGTDGGTFTTGADRTRTLTTEVSDLAGIVTLATNQFTLFAGTYQIDWSAPANQCASHQSWLYNVTDTAVVGRGSTEVNATGTAGTNRSRGSAVAVISGTKAFEIRHRCSATRSTDGFGLAASLGTEVYTQVFIRKIS